MIRKNIPNFLTLMNLSSGVAGILVLFNAEFKTAFILLLIAAFFDFCDGFAARILKAYSETGKILDSLSDLVSFGVLPAVMVFLTLKGNYNSGFMEYAPWLSLMIPFFSAIRLARFTAGDDEKTVFRGLPTPANALIISSLVLCIQTGSPGLPFPGTILITSLILLSLLMVSNLPMLSLKFSHFRLRGNEFRFILLVGCLALIAFFRIEGILLSGLLYLILSLFQRKA